MYATALGHNGRACNCAPKPIMNATGEHIRNCPKGGNPACVMKRHNAVAKTICDAFRYGGADIVVQEHLVDLASETRMDVYVEHDDVQYFYDVSVANITAATHIQRATQKGSHRIRKVG